MGLLIIRLIVFLNGQISETTNHHIALTMLSNYQAIHQLSIGEVAKLCDVSKSTISKFARTLGFDDYLDLKDNAAFVENRFNNPLNYISNIITLMEEDGYDHYFDSILKDINYFKENIDLSTIDRFAKAIYGHKQVVALGAVFSQSAALDFQLKLAYNGKFITTFQNDLAQDAFLRDATEETLIIVFTNSGDYLTKQQIRTGTPKKNSFSQTKAKVIVLSANPEVLTLPFVSDAIIFPHQTNYQTHAVMFQIITDLIIARYRYLNKGSE
ncbi:transcriptional regulator, RpiR family [Amphibacillus marinus]|uniref:Transcriptional regulator, RpiR family n=1 Tax=Amphibacillus marinus TaxID=872970 RepID=A0A1H8KL38_9BACI|nr:MurR/RpiR family transcriptional regulator [Amphibacillus marinus]SEN93683.1 transcriptional regulator, RpiR family [Amphibacillus marinus]